MSFIGQNMKNYIQLILTFIIQLSFYDSLKSQNDFLKVDTIHDYKNWGWDALVIKNRYINVAVVPSMGGNILQYDFGVDTFLLLEPRTFCQSYDTTVSPFDNSWGFGGLETWPTPEAWPPPPFLTYRLFKYTTECSNTDSVVIFLNSEKESTTFPGIKFDRKISVYKNSTRVKIENTIINQNNTDVNYGIMNVNYVSPTHLNENDFNNFSINFPVNKQSKYMDGVYYDPKSKSFLGQIVPGIYSIEFNPSQGKIYADVKDGWASFTDKKDNQAYFKVFDVFENETYPDNGARFEVYIQASDPAFMAMEVISPLKKLSANGGSYTFVDNLYSSQSLQSTVLKANHAGATFERLKYDSISTILRGSFSVFNNGNIKIMIYDLNCTLLQKTDSFKVYPDTIIGIKKEIALPSNTNRIEVQAFNSADDLIGVLDYIDYSEKVSIENVISVSDEEPINLRISNQQIQYNLNIRKAGFVSIILCDITGRQTENIFSGFLNTGLYSMNYQLKSTYAGIYLLVYSNQGKFITRKIFLSN
jgi:hypothetical protein